MDKTLEEGTEVSSRVSSGDNSCDNCGRILGQSLSFAFKSRAVPGTPNQAGELIKCIFCALRHRPMVKRSCLAAVAVGTVLTLLNQGDILLSGHWNNALYWKIPLTYCVPFLVATYGALTSSRK